MLMEPPQYTTLPYTTSSTDSCSHSSRLVTIGPLVLLVLLGITFKLGARRHMQSPPSPLRMGHATVDEEPLPSSESPPPDRRRFSLSAAVSRFSKRFSSVGPAVTHPPSSSLSPSLPTSHRNTHARVGRTGEESTTRGHPQETIELGGAADRSSVPGGGVTSIAHSTIGSSNQIGPGGKTQSSSLSRLGETGRAGSRQGLSQLSFRDIIRTPSPSGHFNAEQVGQGGGKMIKKGGRVRCYILFRCTA